MKLLCAYLLRVISAAMLGAVVTLLSPRNGAGKVVKLTCGLILIVCVISPVLKLDADDLLEAFSRTELYSEQARTGVEIPTRDLTAEIISRHVGAYVLDKAAEMGLNVEVEVSMHAEGQYPYPETITIKGAVNEAQRRALTAYMQTDLAIPADRQEFVP